MRRYLIAAVAALLMLGTGAATAQARPAQRAATKAVVYVYNASGSVLDSQTRAAVRGWDKAQNIDLQLVKSPCFGASCIVVESVTTHPAGTCANTMGGCEFTWPEEFGLCHVTVTNNIDGWLADAVTTHEVGHCLGMPHIDLSVDPKTVMAPAINGNDFNRVPSQRDIALLDSMWADGYEPPAT